MQMLPAPLPSEHPDLEAAAVETWDGARCFWTTSPGFWTTNPAGWIVHPG